MPPPHPAPLPETPIFQTPDELLRDIFLRLPTAADLARASAACPSFRRLITDHAFLRRYRAHHPPPLIGAFDDSAFIPAQPPHPSAFAARAFAGFDFSCSSFLPSTTGRTWSAIDFLDGRALLDGAPVPGKGGSSHLRYFSVRDLAVCDPVHGRYILLPAVPGDLKALVSEPDLLHLETFLAPGDDEEDPLSFRVMCLLQCRMNLLLLVFSSLDWQWHSLAFDQWSAQATFAPLEGTKDGLSDRQFVHGCFCWRFPLLNKLVLLDTRAMEFSAVNLPPEQGWSSNFVIVEAAEGMLGMLAEVYDRGNMYEPCWLRYSILRNNQWHLEKVIPLPEMHHVVLLGVGGGYLLIGAMYITSSGEEVMFGLFSVDVKTLQVELFAELSKIILSGRLYAGFPPSLCAPTI
ncbi:hypothetical protein CFC21_038433 [Triticum aestivum]|uniref:F-box domain-containing protein n=3 Tax=Triticum TaxID=4564 RepID=A0A3B6ET70_WHEAT|nr:uncharacterized protein LOC123063577 [Triticum aestivum]KAF7026318.1 hypothetical protein CFC21_038433 [Triticum aestivum]